MSGKLRRGRRGFRASVFKMLKEEGKIGDDLINRLMSWRHSGFSVHNGVRVRRDDDGGREALAQYIIRNTFPVDKLTYIKETATVIYRSKMTHGNNNKKNFEVYTPEEFIAAITQHIPEKSFLPAGRQVRWYATMDGIQTRLPSGQVNHEGSVTSRGLRDLLMNR